MKKTENLQIALVTSDIDHVDDLCARFHAFPPKRAEIARVLIRFAIAKVHQRPSLLKAICRLFDESAIADISDIEGFDEETERRLSEAERHGRSRAEALAVMLRIGGKHFEAMGYEDYGKAEAEAPARLAG